MFCPVCGGKLEYVDQPEGLNEEEERSWLGFKRSKAPEEFRCEGNGCFGNDFPLLFHHPSGGIDSAPGDSWSLSWIK